MAMTFTPTPLRFAISLLIATCFGLGIFFMSQSSTARNQTAAAPPPPSVEVATVEPQEIRTWMDFSGRLAPIASVEIKPQVGGRIDKVFFTDGAVVEAGQALFLIDPRPHEAALNRARAQLKAAQASAEQTQSEFTRSESLLSSKLISQSLYDERKAASLRAEAAVTEALAAVQQAELNVEYARITAPVAGRLSRAEITEGNVVEAGVNAPVLTRIVTNEQFYVEFNVDEQTYLQFIRATEVPQDMPVRVALGNEDAVEYDGKIYAFDNRLDSRTGTIRARAIIDNDDGVLTAGMYARVSLGSPQKQASLLVPERAIGTNQDKKYVLVVDENNVANYRPVTLGGKWQAQRIVVSGLQSGEKVIVNGLSHVRPGATVSPSEAKTLAAAH